MTDEQKSVDALLLKKITEAESFEDRALAVEAYYRFNEICCGAGALAAFSKSLSCESE